MTASDSKAAPGHPVLDLNGACEDLDLTREEILILVPRAMDEIQETSGLVHQALAANALGTVHRHAHTIKSVAASIGARGVVQAAAALELHTKTPPCTDCSRLANILGQNIESLVHAVEAISD